MPTCARSSCILCAMNNEADPPTRKAAIKEHIKAIPLLLLDASAAAAAADDDDQLILVVSGLWKVAMARPDDDELPSLGIFECMASLLEKSIRDREWLLKNQNIYIPYYAAHIIGSYTMKNVDLAVRAVESGVIPPLMDLLRGKMTWVEKRVSIRALGHLASYERTFMDVALYEGEIVQMAMDMALSCPEEVYNTFLGVEDKRRRLQYHRDLLGRGVSRGVELENRKAEEWAGQMRSWSIHLLNCFAIKERSLDIICKEGFLKELSQMWGGLLNNHRSSPDGVGLIRIICYSRVGRRYVSKCSRVIENLCHLSRSSDEWQYVAVDCLLLLLNDLDSRYDVIHTSTLYLVDLIEVKNLGNKMNNVGEKIARALLYDYHEKHQHPKMFKIHAHVQRVLDQIWDLKMDKSKREKVMSRESLEQKRAMAKSIKQQGDQKYSVGEVEGAISKYSEALEICPLRQRKERVGLYSNRARCYLWVREVEAAISDATRALCLCRPLNSHASSLWTRSQAYEMKGMAKESLMDCVALVNIVCGKQGVVPYYAVRMMAKQMEQTWIFRAAQMKAKESRKHRLRNKGRSVEEKNSYISGLWTILEEPFGGRERREVVERA